MQACMSQAAELSALGQSVKRTVQNSLPRCCAYKTPRMASKLLEAVQGMRMLCSPGS
jgi:hypothetical protein